MREFAVKETKYKVADISFKPNQSVSAGERPVCKMYYILGIENIYTGKESRYFLFLNKDCKSDFADCFSRVTFCRDFCCYNTKERGGEIDCCCELTDL